MNARLDKVRILVSADPYADTSYLGQEGFEQRREQFEQGAFSFCGVQVDAEILVPLSDHGQATYAVQHITSPGLWGIEDDSGEDYLRSVATDEGCVLLDMLTELNVKVPRGQFNIGDAEITYEAVA